jgi:hypothetical protein
MTRPIWSRTARILVAVLMCAGLALTTAATGRAAARAQWQAGSGSRVGRPAVLAVASPGTNLLLNGGTEAGAVSRQGWDSVTIPGWHVLRGLPTVVSYGTPGFPGRADAATHGRGRQLFAGGAGGTAELSQRIPLRTAAGKAPSGSRFSVAAWLGGNQDEQGRT